MLRYLRSMRHWGPVNRKEVELLAEADELFSAVQQLLVGGQGMDIAHITELRSRVAVLKELSRRIRESHDDDDDEAVDEAVGLLDENVEGLKSYVAAAAEGKPLPSPPEPEDPPA